jgi:(2Fe-2S) ferredoxin
MAGYGLVGSNHLRYCEVGCVVIVAADGVAFTTEAEDMASVLREGHECRDAIDRDSGSLC